MRYSHFVRDIVFHHWPHGRHQTTARFWIERDPKRGDRCCRTTIDPKTGKESKPKKLTFSPLQYIAKGEDDKTYIVTFRGSHITVMQSNMQYEQETIWPVVGYGEEQKEDPRYMEMVQLAKAEGVPA